MLLQVTSTRRERGETSKDWGKKEKKEKVEKELQRETLTLLNFSCHHAISYL